jgi:hypothetical protein
MSDTLIWVILGLLAAFANTGSPLMQEKLKGNAFSVAVWIKLGTVALILPFVLYFGLPVHLNFYIFAAVSGLIWSVSDVLYFRTVSDVGAGVVSRLLPAAVLLSFLVWFLFDPSLLTKYLDHPTQGLAALGIVCAASFCAMNLKSCPVTVRGFKAIWFVILAAAIGPLIEKISMGNTPKAQTPFAFIFIQALMMLGFWGIFALIKRPVSLPTFLHPSSWKTGLTISLFTTTALCLRFTALQYVQHPAFLSVILFTDAVWIIAYYKITGHRDDSKIWAGLGIVGCAAALILVKNI